MQCVHRHVVQGAAAGPTEVPARIDRVSTSEALRLVLVVAVERGAADRPHERPDLLPLDPTPELLVVRAKHLSRRGDDLQIPLPGQLDQLCRLGSRRRHRLVEVHVLPRLERLPALLVMQPDRRGDRDRIHLTEQILVRGEAVRDAEMLRRPRRPPFDGIAHHRHAHAILDVRLGEMREEAALRKRPGSHDAEPDQRRCSVAPPVRCRSADR